MIFNHFFKIAQHPVTLIFSKQIIDPFEIVDVQRNNTVLLMLFGKLLKVMIKFQCISGTCHRIKIRKMKQQSCIFPKSIVSIEHKRQQND